MTVAATTAPSRHGGTAQGASLADPASRPDGDAQPSVGPALFRAVMRHHAKGVAVITAGAQTPIGFCVTSLASVSLDPLLASFTVGLRTASWTTVRAAERIMVHLLADDQEELARHFAQAGGEKFGPPIRWHRGLHDLPVLDDVLACLVLAPVRQIVAGDHALIIGQVTTAWHQADGSPLIHHNGEFARLAASHRAGTSGRFPNGA